MTQTEKQKLRELAGKATPWKADDKEPATKEWRKNLDNNAEFCRAANPVAAISLLDEIERLRKALEIYAFADSVEVISYDAGAPVTIDRGEYARAALKGTNEQR